MKCFLVFFLCAFLAGCSSIDTGLVDFRRADGVGLTKAAIEAEAHKNKCAITISGHPKVCAPMLESTLFRKNVGKKAKSIGTDDVYSIRLDYGVIADINEYRKIRNRKDHRFGKNGEIAILVKAFEFSATEDGAQRFLDFQQLTKAEDGSNSDDFSEARVVYFNPDVDPGQAMNFSNIPILGPVKYEGRPVGLQLIVIELDQMSEPVKTMLQNLAGLGRSYANAGPVTDALFDLGTSLLEGSQDDIIFEYRMVMDNSNHIGDQIVSSFEEGRVVFRRAQNRKNKFVWRNLRLDENSGALYEKALANNSTVTPSEYEYKVFDNETYLVVNFINHGKTGPEGFYDYQTFAKLESQLQNYVDERAKPVIETQGEIIELMKSRQSGNRSKKIKSLIDTAGDDWEAYANYFIPNNFEGDCDLKDEIDAKSSLRRLRHSYANQKTSGLYTLLQESATEILQPREGLEVVTQLSNLILGKLGNENPISNSSYKIEDFVSWTSFKNAYITPTNGQEKFRSLIKQAAENSAETTCLGLNARH